MTTTEVLDALFSAQTWEMPTPELGLPGRALQFSTPAGSPVLTVVLCKDPDATKTAAYDNGGVPIGHEDALYFWTGHRVTFVDRHCLRLDRHLPQPPGDMGILKDLSSHCRASQPHGGYWLKDGSYIHGDYQEAPVHRGNEVTGSAYFLLEMGVVVSGDADSPAGAKLLGSAGPGGIEWRWGWGKGLFSWGLGDPGQGAIAFEVVHAEREVRAPLVRFKALRPAELPNPKTVGPAICFFDEGKGRGPEPIYSNGRRWNRLSVE